MSVSLNLSSPKPMLKWLKLALKVAVTCICFWYISTKINFVAVASAWVNSNGFWLFAAVCSFMLSKILSAFRLNIYFKNIDIFISQRTNIKLYWLGMFYNLFLPGSIGGDAYKIVRLTKTFNVPYKKTATAILLDRFSGLFALFLLASLLWLFVFKGSNYSVLIVLASIIIIPVGFLAVKKLVPYFSKSFLPTYAWGIGVQIFQLLCMFCIVKGLHVNTQYEQYLLLFMVSSVVAVLPFTIGGLGGREMVFLWGANLLHLDMHTAVAASVLFYFTTVIASSFGLPMVFIDPLKMANDN